MRVLGTRNEQSVGAADRRAQRPNGSWGVSSRSGLKSGRSPRPARTRMLMPSGASRAAARQNAELIEAARRLPEIARTFMAPDARLEQRAGRASSPHFENAFHLDGDVVWQCTHTDCHARVTPGVSQHIDEEI